VLGGLDGAENGTISVNVSSDGGGTGSFKVGGVVTALANVTTTGGHLSATGNGFTFTGTINGAVIDGSYNSPSGGGLVAPRGKGAAATIVEFCAAHSGTDDSNAPVSGVYNVALNTSPNAIRGVCTSGTGNPIKRRLSGFSGDDQAVMSGHPGTVTILPDLGSSTVGGFYDLDSGAAGTMSGGLCP
jgi:hypothetical protein